MLSNYIQCYSLLFITFYWFYAILLHIDTAVTGANTGDHRCQWPAALVVSCNSMQFNANQIKSMLFIAIPYYYAILTKQICISMPAITGANGPQMPAVTGANGPRRWWFHAVRFNSMQLNATQIKSMLFNAIQCYSWLFNIILCKCMQFYCISMLALTGASGPRRWWFHAIRCNSMQFNAYQCYSMLLNGVQC